MEEELYSLDQIEDVISLVLKAILSGDYSIVDDDIKTFKELPKELKLLVVGYTSGYKEVLDSRDITDDYIKSLNLKTENGNNN